MVLSAPLTLWFYSFLSESPLYLQPLTFVSLPVCASLKRAFVLIMDLGKLYGKCESIRFLKI